MTEWPETFRAELETWAQTIAASDVGAEGTSHHAQRAAAELTAPAIDHPRQALASELERRSEFQAALDAERSRPFDLAELTIEGAAEAGRWVAGTWMAGSAAEAGQENKQTALLDLHGRAVTIAREVVTMAHGGYGTGALSRWRALHEMWVVFTVLRDQDEELCHRYLEYGVIDDLKLQEDYAQAWDTVGEPPPGFSPLERNRRRAALVMRFGNTFLREYGWAAPLFEGRPPRFRELQTLVQLEPLPGTHHGPFPPPPAGGGGIGLMDAAPTALIAVVNVTAGLLDAAAECADGDRLHQARAQLRRHALITMMDRAVDEFLAVARRTVLDGPRISPFR